MRVFCRTSSSEADLTYRLSAFPHSAGSQQSCTAWNMLEMCILTHAIESFQHIPLHEVSLLCLFTSPPAQDQSSQHPTLATSSQHCPPTPLLSFDALCLAWDCSLGGRCQVSPHCIQPMTIKIKNRISWHKLPWSSSAVNPAWGQLTFTVSYNQHTHAWGPAAKQLSRLTVS